MNWRVFIQLTGVLFLFSTEILAQGFVENALLFSRTRPGGSARIQAMGGAQIALGGDFSSALSNPAGLGMYNRSEATFSFGQRLNQVDATHFGTTENNSKNQFHIPGLSYVHHSPQERGGFLGGSFGFSMTRTNDFNWNIGYSGQDNISSVIDYFIQDANGLSPSQLNFDFPTGLAYDNFLIEDSTFFGGPQNLWFSVMGLYDDPDDIRRLTRRESISTSGAQNQWSISYGANFNDKLFVGAGIGISGLRYKYSSVYRESNYFFELDPTFNPLNNLQLEETIEIEGTGFNFTLGFIYRPIDNLQVGASFVTPTYYQVTDTYFARLSTLWNNYNYLGTGQILNAISHESGSPIVSEYNLTTPLKFSVGVAYFISNHGFLTADVELINYRSARYRSDIGGISFDPENSIISSAFSSVVNMRLGGEFRVDRYRFRAGYNVQSNPYDEQFDIESSINTISAGAGVRVKRFFADLAWLGTRGESKIFPYIFQNGYAPTVDLSSTTNTFLLTLGVNF